MGGPSQQSKDNAKAQADFYKQATAEQSQVFSEDQALLQKVEAVAIPILNLGPNQFGFSDAEWKDLQSSIISNVSKGTADAINAMQLSERQKAGGAQVLPAGAEEQLETQANIIGAQNKANQLTSERLTGYNIGRQNYQMALGALTGEQQMLNPSTYTSAATGAGESATKAIQLQDSERSNLLSSVLGGVIGAGESFLTGGLSNITKGGSFLTPP